MNNEPVAWMNYVEHSDFYDLNINGRGIPLYTHSVKKLTDKEILEIANGCLVSATAWHNPELDPIKFAKAILRKAQEK